MKCETISVGKDAKGKLVQSVQVQKGEAEVSCSEADVMEFVSGVVWELWEMESWNYDPVGWFGRRGVNRKYLKNKKRRKRTLKKRISRAKLKTWIEQEKLRIAEGRSLPKSENPYATGDEAVAPSLSAVDMQLESALHAKTGESSAADTGENRPAASCPTGPEKGGADIVAKKGLSIVDPVEVEWSVKV